MFTLTRPHSIDASFEQMYRYLIGILEPLAGYPLKLERGPARTSDAAVRPSRREDGSIEFPLHSSKNRKATWSLVVPPDGAADRQCTRIVTRFMLTCNRLAREIRQSSGIKDYLVRNGVFMWDDLVVSLTHAGGQKINTLELIAALRETLLFRYEERPVRVGVLMTWNWHSTSKYLSEAGCHVLTTRKPDDIQRTLRDSKALNWLADGTNSLLLLTPKGRVGGWFSISALRTPEPTADWSMVPHRYHHLRKLLVGEDVICTTSQTGELFLFRKDSVMKWTHEGWRRVSGPGITGSLSAYVPEEAASVLSDVAVDMSFRKRGRRLARAELVFPRRPPARNHAGRFPADCAHGVPGRMPDCRFGGCYPQCRSDPESSRRPYRSWRRGAFGRGQLREHSRACDQNQPGRPDLDL